MILIADASPLIALALCDCLDVLEKLFNEVRVSRMVYEEVTFKNKTGSEKLISSIKPHKGQTITNRIRRRLPRRKTETLPCYAFRYIIVQIICTINAWANKICKL